MRDIRIQSGSIGIQVRDYEGEGEPLILLHFGGGNLMMWRRAVPFFQEEFRVIVPDLRGHGKSDKPESGNDIDTMAQDVLIVMDQLGVKKVHLVGSSLGAEVGLALAASYPDRVRSLVCEGALHSEFGPYGTWEGTESEFLEFVEKQIKHALDTPEEVFPSADAYVAEKRRIYQKYGWWNEYVKTAEEYDAYRLPTGEFTSSWRKHSRIAYQKRYFGYRFEDYYSRLNSSVLMLPGAHEMKNSRFREIAEGLKKLTPAAELVEVPGWVHPYGWMLDCEEMCNTIRSFLYRNNMASSDS